MQSKRIDRSLFLIWSTSAIGLIFYGLLALIYPAILLDSFQANLSAFPAGSVRSLGYLAGLYRLLGWFNLLLGLSAAWLLLQWRVKQISSHQNAAFVLLVLAYLGPVIFDNTLGAVGFFEVIEHILMAALLISGALLVWEKKPVMT